MNAEAEGMEHGAGNALGSLHHAILNIQIGDQSIITILQGV